MELKRACVCCKFEQAANISKPLLVCADPCIVNLLGSIQVQCVSMSGAIPDASWLAASFGPSAKALGSGCGSACCNTGSVACMHAPCISQDTNHMLAKATNHATVNQALVATGLVLVSSF